MSEEVSDSQTEEPVDDWAAAMAEQGDTESSDTESGDEIIGGPDELIGTSNAVDEGYEKAAFQNLNDNSTQLVNTDTNLDVILDIPVTLSMEIGRTELPINSLLQLNQGSVVELDRLAGEPMDVLINGTLIAHGEVVVVNEKFGIRLTDVISPAERVKKLK